MPTIPAPPLTKPLLLPDGKSNLTWADWYKKVENGIVTGAPTDAFFVTTKANTDLTNGVNLGDHPSGLVTSTSSGGTATLSTVDVLPQSQGGTGLNATTALDGQLLIGRTADHTLQLGVLTPGLGISVTPGSGSLTVSQTLPALTAVSPANPTGTTSAVGVMMGLAIAFTPARTGRALVIVGANLINASPGGETRAQLRFGTGAAPANGAALTGTITGTEQVYDAFAGGTIAPCSLNTILTGLTLGLAIWIDVDLVSLGGGLANFQPVTASVVEI